MYICSHKRLFMNTHIHLSQVILHFRRWSRHKFAAFCSMGKCVNIGTLDYRITDISLKKQTSSLTTEKISYIDNEEKEKRPEDFFYKIILHSEVILKEAWNSNCTSVFHTSTESVYNKFRTGNTYYLCVAGFLLQNIT